jgi:hypothetical protein
MQLWLQQSAAPVQAAPAGPQSLRQANPALPSGRQDWLQHCSGTEHGAPEGEQPVPEGRQRITVAVSARQVAPAQHSPAFMHDSPMTRHLSATAGPGFPQRPTPSGPALHTPEQQVPPLGHRSCSG